MDRIEKLIERMKEVSVSHLARESGVARSTIFDIIERRSVNPGVLTVDKIETALSRIKNETLEARP
jgi:predicted transcriptional regulator